MLLFGHVGITSGVVWGWDKYLRHKIPFAKKTTEASASIAGSIDYRLVVIGSMLPDIIDKPIGHLIFADALSNYGRIYAHSMLFFAILLVVGLYRYHHSGKLGFLILSLCSGFHLILDKMWYFTQTLFWPLKGWGFPESDFVDLFDWISSLNEGFKTNPQIYISETIGSIIILFIALKLFKNNRLLSFIKTGHIHE